MINPHQDMSRQSTPHYGSVSADHHGRDRIIEAANNESPYPPLPSVVQVVADAAARMNRYPDPAVRALTEALAEYWHIGATHSRLRTVRPARS